jgi:hypothetical protein
MKRPIFSSDTAVQTEKIGVGVGFQVPALQPNKMDIHEDQESTLSASDLASILKWSKDISSDINLASGKQVTPTVVTNLLRDAFSSAATHGNSHR